MNELAQAVDAIVAGPRGLSWQSMTEAGFTGVGLPEASGGSGGSLADAAIVLERMAYHGAAMPLAESAWLAGWLLAEARQPLPAGPSSAAHADLSVSGGLVSGVLRRVPYASAAGEIVALGDGFLCRVDPARCVIEPGSNLAGEPRDDVILPGIAAPVIPTAVSARDLLLRGAAARSVQLSGAARRALELSVRYAAQREQFGRPIGRFQAVQQQLAVLASEVFVLDVSVATAVRAHGTAQWPLTVAAAKYNASRAAREIARIAHQVHGAIGVAHEHDLRLSTTRLWSWAAEFGSARYWAGYLGDLSTGCHPWAFVTATKPANREGVVVE